MINTKNTSERTIFYSMRFRCNNPTYRQYANYGGRGIKVCDRWSSFGAFFEDMGPRPKGLTLERINNDGNYEPANCRWATREEQNCNRRNNRIVTFRGQQMALGAAMRLANCSVGFNSVASRLRRGWDLERALTEPLKTAQETRQAHIEWRRNGSPRRSQSL